MVRSYVFYVYFSLNKLDTSSYYYSHSIQLPFVDFPKACKLKSDYESWINKNTRFFCKTSWEFSDVFANIDPDFKQLNIPY